jgi:hypothetical protein
MTQPISHQYQRRNCTARTFRVRDTSFDARGNRTRQITLVHLSQSRRV